MSSSSSSVSTVVLKFYEDYQKSTPTKLKLVDAYLLYVLLTGIVQFVYCCLVGTFPFNSFLSGFISCVGSFVLGACLRLQVNPANKGQFVKISPERAFADFIFAHLVLHLTVFNFIG
nr:EOG090X0KAT [Sida crystallina]